MEKIYSLDEAEEAFAAISRGEIPGLKDERQKLVSLIAARPDTIKLKPALAGGALANLYGIIVTEHSYTKEKKPGEVYDKTRAELKSWREKWLSLP